MREKVVVAWSGGKDSALALYEILNSGGYEVKALLTTVTRDYDRVSIHGVRRVLLEQQAKALRIPLEEMFIPKGASNAEYESELLKALMRHRDRASARWCSATFFWLMCASTVRASWGKLD